MIQENWDGIVRLTRPSPSPFEWRTQIPWGRMVFSSIVFIFIFYFLPAFLLAYYLSGWRTAVLLGGSALFYAGGEGKLLALLAVPIAANYAAVYLMDQSGGRARPTLLTIIIVTDLAVLGWFKYAGFIGRSLNEILRTHPSPRRRTT